MPCAQSAWRHRRTASTLKPIERVEVGELVLAWDLASGGAVRRRVERLYRRNSREVLSVLVQDAAVQTRITATLEHPFWVHGRGWVPAAGLQHGDLLQGRDGSAVAEVNAIECCGQHRDVYNIEVGAANNYFITPRGVLVHNESTDPDLMRSALEHEMDPGLLSHFVSHLDLRRHERTNRIDLRDYLLHPIDVDADTAALAQTLTHNHLQGRVPARRTLWEAAHSMPIEHYPPVLQAFALIASRPLRTRYPDLVLKPEAPVALAHSVFGPRYERSRDGLALEGARSDAHPVRGQDGPGDEMLAIINMYRTCGVDPANTPIFEATQANISYPNRQLEEVGRIGSLLITAEHVAAGQLEILNGELSNYGPIRERSIVRSPDYDDTVGLPRSWLEWRNLNAPADNPWRRLDTAVAFTLKPSLAYVAMEAMLAEQPHVVWTLDESMQRATFRDDMEFLLHSPLSGEYVERGLRRMAAFPSHRELAADLLELKQLRKKMMFYFDIASGAHQ